jgi:3-oxoacid CoA-transferase subunit B
MHTNPKGQSKLLKKCQLPLTGIKCVKKIVTNLAVIEVTDKGFQLLEKAPGISVEEIQHKTEGNLIVDSEIPDMQW